MKRDRQDIRRLNRRDQTNGFFDTKRGGGPERVSRGLRFQNKSGATIPAYGCMALFPATSGDSTVNGVPYFRALKMTSTSNIPNMRWAFNGPRDVPNDGWGEVQAPIAGEFYIALHDGTAAVDKGLSYKFNSHELELNGVDYWCAGKYRDADDLMIVQRNPGKFIFMGFAKETIVDGPNESGSCDVYFGKIGSGGTPFPGDFWNVTAYNSDHGNAIHVAANDEIWLQWCPDEYLWRILPIGNVFDT